MINKIILNSSWRINCLMPIFTILLTGCGSSEPTADEAYRVGYDIGLSDECSRYGERKEQMPSAYDDSLDKGELSSAFQDGYWAARSESRPCKYD